jgi:hypothetical protein
MKFIFPLKVIVVKKIPCKLVYYIISGIFLSDGK